MSTIVDERVLSMEFDNKRFESNVSTTMSTLDKLKNSLKMTGASKGLETVGTAAQQQRNIFDELEVTSTRAGFSLRDVWLKVASVFEYQIAGRIISAGKNMVSALTIDPIKTGLAEYETQLNSVQTILANTESKGSTLEDVNAALDELNLYADKTIYNFTQMTRNIGTFTAAGVDLDTSVAAIKGIANLAAVSGSTSQQASTAMYQLSQALSSGTVRLMDWNSVVNAGMGGQVFQDALKETARVHGVAIDDIIEKQGSFRESLKDGWLTSDILTETLSKFTGDLSEEQLRSMGYTEKQIEEIIKLGKTANDAATKVKTFTQLIDTLKESAQSGWAQTWELLIGDFEEAKELWTGVSDVLGGLISSSADARNELLSGTLNSGWDKLLDAGIMDEDGYSYHIKSVAKKHGIAIDEMIKKEGSLEKALQKGFETGEISSNILSEALNTLATKYSKCSEEELKNLGYTKEQVTALTELNKKIQNGSMSMEEFAKQIGKVSGRELLLDSFSNLYKAIVAIVKPIKNAFTEIFPPTTSEQLYKIIEGFNSLTKKLILSEKNQENLKRTFKGLFAVVDIGVTVIKTLFNAFTKILGCFSGVGDGILGVTGSLGDFLVSVRDSIKETGSFANIVKTFTDRIANFITSVKEFATQNTVFTGLLSILNKVWSVVKKVFGGIADFVKDAFASFSNGGGNIFDIINTALVGGALYKLRDIIPLIKNFFGAFGDIVKEVTSPFSEISKLFGTLTDSLKAFQDKLKSETIKTLAISIAILAGSLLVLSLIDKNKLESSLAAIAMCAGILIGTMAIFNKMDKSGLKSVGSMIGIASSLLVLSIALKILSSMEWAEIGRGLAVMAGALLILGTFIASISHVSDVKTAAKATKQLSTIAFALVVLGGALKILGTMGWDEIGRSLTVMAASLAILGAVLEGMSKISKDGRGAGQLVVLSISLVILGGALKILGTMGWDEIGRALTVMSSALIILCVVLEGLAHIPSAGKGVAQLLVLSNALMILSLSLKLLSSMSWDDIGRSLTSMSVALGILVGVLALLSLVSKISGAGSLIASSAAILIMSSSLIVLAGALAIMGNMKTETITQGLLTIAAAFGILGVAGLVLKSAVPAILSLSASLMALGVSTVLIGSGITILAVGISMLLTGIASGIAIIMASLGSLIDGILAILPKLLVMVKEVLVGLCNVIIEGAPKIGEAVIAVVFAVINILVQSIPELVSGLLSIILGVLKALIEYVPNILDALVDLLVSVLESLVNYVPKLVKVLFDVFAKIFDGLIECLNSVDPETLLKTLASVGLIAALIYALSAITALIPGAMAGVLGMGLVIAELALVLAAIGKFSQIPGLSDLIADGGNLLMSIGTAIGQFIGGIIGGIGLGMTSTLPEMATNLSNFMTNLTPFFDGIRSVDKGMMENAKNLASTILTLTAANLLNQLTAWLSGGVSLSEFASELAEFGKGINDFANEVKGVDPETVKAAAIAGKNLAEMANAIPASGGLWELLAGGKSLTDFGNELGPFGECIKTFADSVKGLDANATQNASAAVKNVAEMASQLPTSGGLWNAVAGEVDMADFGAKLVAFGEAVKSFVSTASGIGDVQAVVTKLQTLSDGLSKFSTETIANLDTTLGNIGISVNNTINSIIQNVAIAVQSKVIELSVIATSMITTFAKAITDSKQIVVDACVDVIESAKTSMGSQSYYDSFYNTGTYLMSGLASGISNKSSVVVSAAQSVASTVLGILRTIFQINSPSKATYEDGVYLVEGLAKALDDNGNTIFNAGSDMANSAINGLHKAISKAGDIINNEMDGQLTITPVLDLSQVNAGAKAINGMFGMNPSVGVLSNVGSINSLVNKNQNRSQNDVVSAIKDLSNKIDNVSGDTYNINGITYDNGSELQAAFETIIRAAKIEGRV